MRNQVLQITKEIFSEYKEGFIYIDNEQMDFANIANNQEIRGKFQFTGSAYLKTHSKILNNTEAMFIFNQLQYNLLTAILIEKRKINPLDRLKTYDKLDGIVYKEMHFTFNKMIGENDILNFICRADHYLDHKNRDCFNVELSLVNDAFVITGTAVCINSAVHREGAH